MAANPLNDPLTFAVKDIVEGSGLFQTNEQFLPVMNTKTVKRLPVETVWPIVSAHTSTIRFNATDITKTLVIMCYFPFPGVRSGITPLDNMAVLVEAETYMEILMDVVDWLIGKHKIPSASGKGPGTSAYDFTLVGDAEITPMYWDEERRQEVLSENVWDVVAIAMAVTFTGTRQVMTTPILQPKLSGTSKNEFLVAEKKIPERP